MLPKAKRTGTTWVIADPHFGHAGVTRFTVGEGDGAKPLRPWDTVEDMDQALVDNWNSVVKDGDRVYLLGDATMSRRSIATLNKLNGRIVLVKGNHDVYGIKDYAPSVDDIRACVVVKASSQRSVVLTHIPIHPQCLDRWAGNIHGHLHANSIDDPRYVCVSVEQTNYYPVELDAILARFA
jgi:calcineurin-like phosphoesterase family protein